MGREPIPLRTPSGIKIKPSAAGDRIQIFFMFDGVECRELLPPGKINKTYIDYAVGLRAEIKRKIADGLFVYAQYFPKSRRAKVAAPAVKLLTVGDLLRKQLALYSKQGENGTLEASTLLGYSKAIKNNLLPHFDKLTLQELTPSLLREWVAGLGVTAKTARNRLTPLRSMLDDAVNDELIDSNPLDRIALKKLLKQTSSKSSYEVDPLDHLEVEALLKACRSDERAMIQFWIFTGLRPGELIALPWSSVDFVHGKVRIENNQVTGMQNGEVTRVSKAPKTQAGIRDIDLSPEALLALAAQKAVSFLQGGQVWMNPRTGEPWGSDAQIRRTLWEPLCKRAGVRYRNPYQMRHTYASTLLTAGSNPFWVASQLGHVDVEMVFKVYGRFIPKNYSRLQEIDAKSTKSVQNG